MRTCLHPNCNNEVTGRKGAKYCCTSHQKQHWYQRHWGEIAKKWVKRTDKVNGTCAFCEGVKRSPKRIYCSARCRGKASRIREILRERRHNDLA